MQIERGKEKKNRMAPTSIWVENSKRWRKGKKSVCREDRRKNVE